MKQQHPVHPSNIFTGATHPVSHAGRNMTTVSGWLTSIGLRRGFTEHRNHDHRWLMLEYIAGEQPWHVQVKDFRPEVVPDGSTNVLSLRFMSLNQARREYVRLCRSLYATGSIEEMDPMIVRQLPAAELKDGDVLYTGQGLYRVAVVSRSPMITLNLTNDKGDLLDRSVLQGDMVHAVRRESEWEAR